MWCAHAGVSCSLSPKKDHKKGPSELLLLKETDKHQKMAQNSCTCTPGDSACYFPLNLVKGRSFALAVRYPSHWRYSCGQNRPNLPGAEVVTE